MKIPPTTRRNFLKSATLSAGALAVGNPIPASAVGANDRIHFGVIGCGGMGTGHVGSLVKRSEADHIDWDTWLGHQWGLAPKIPWTPEHFFRFRKYWPYNGGVATDLLYHKLACNAELGCATMVAIKMAVESFRQSKTLLWDAQKEKVVAA